MPMVLFELRRLEGPPVGGNADNVADGPAELPATDAEAPSELPAEHIACLNIGIM